MDDCLQNSYNHWKRGKEKQWNETGGWYVAQIKVIFSRLISVSISMQLDTSFLHTGNIAVFSCEQSIAEKL